MRLCWKSKQGLLNSLSIYMWQFPTRQYTVPLCHWACSRFITYWSLSDLCMTRIYLMQDPAKCQKLDEIDLFLLCLVADGA